MQADGKSGKQPPLQHHLLRRLLSCRAARRIQSRESDRLFKRRVRRGRSYVDGIVACSRTPVAVSPPRNRCVVVGNPVREWVVRCERIDSSRLRQSIALGCCLRLEAHQRRARMPVRPVRESPPSLHAARKGARYSRFFFPGVPTERTGNSHAAVARRILVDAGSRR